MAEQIQLEIVTPDRKVMSQPVDYVGAPGIEGEFGIMANHVPFLSALGIGNLYFKEQGRYHYVFVAGGFAEVSSNKVTILAEIAELAAEIDVERAKRSRERAEERLRIQKEEVDFARARAQLQRAMARMRCRSSAESAGTCSI
ncbi:F0F1 ATP synthase subunit epsilon [Desulfohalovibrio reitneri]|jgi:F-type H+-transporting ATPase subunit epsilon|uniref:F0F1 ATP synthase subunit epsilon n=1 Tax=Desulfohalovibrio reitneri TaxID=1307759 RepID=UPI0004A6D7D4|nr:F0F1 ATP synthase subunit epsilon [Desulfohalovibrio reitneri]